MGRQLLVGLAAVALVGIFGGMTFSDDPQGGGVKKTGESGSPIVKIDNGPSTRPGGGWGGGGWGGGAASRPAGPMEMIDNPQFESWSKFKVGTSITVETSTNYAKTTNTGETTYTLKEVAADKLILDVKTTTKGKDQDKPTERTHQMTVQPKIPKMTFPQGKGETKETKGEEEIKFGDKTFKCEWKETERTSEMGGRKFVTKNKIWNCKDMPGGIVKSEMISSSDGENAYKSEYKTEVVEVKLAE